MTVRIIALFFALALIPLNGSAHVRVFPEAEVTQTPACGFTTFVMRVPVEKPIATTRIDLTIPKGVIVFAVQPKPSWQYALTTTKGVISAISWIGRLNPKEFDEFSFLAATPKMPETIAWDAIQTYEDGSTVKWTGSPTAQTPHSMTNITAAPCKVHKRK